MRRFQFHELGYADLVIDAIYEAQPDSKNIAGEPLAQLTGTGNQGGFRFSGSIASPNLVVLYTTMDEIDWPDHLDEESGMFTYFGDNRKPGYELHDRRAGRGGNEILRRSFELAHSGKDGRSQVPPFLIFSRTTRGRDVQFRGLAVPGAQHLDQSSDLVAIWKSADGKRFQNYRAIFTILDEPRLDRGWISELQAGVRNGGHCPGSWTNWVATGKAQVLRATKTTRIRSSEQQLGGPIRAEMAHAIHRHFSPAPVRFEHFARDLVLLMDDRVVSLDVTRPTRDGGRDGVGLYRVGMPQNAITVDFAMEAKCYDPQRGLGVTVISRLISRLRHRQFGVLVTTSYLADQAYQEIVDDGHPIIVCAGGDMAELLQSKMGLNSGAEVARWLGERYPLDAS